jgi:hypothetical protein
MTSSKSIISMLRLQKISSYGLTTLWNIASTTTKFVFQDVQKADYNFTKPFAYLKHHFRDFVQIAFLNAQNVEKAFEWYFYIMKHRFIDINKVAF